MNDMSDVFGGLFGGNRPPSKPTTKSPPTEKGVPIRGRKIDGNQYVRASDIADYLAKNPTHGVPGLKRAMDRHSTGDQS